MSTSETKTTDGYVVETAGEHELHRYNVGADDGVELALTHLVPSPDAHKTPVVFVHGSYTRRNFWISPKGIGLAAHLADAGYDCWVPELRGHGFSPKTAAYPSWTADDHMRRDLPALQQFIFEQTGWPAFWVGHSAGGLFILASLAAGWMDRSRAAGVVTAGSQIAFGDEYLQWPLVAPFFKALIKRMGSFDASRFGLGPEHEPAGEMIEYIEWKQRVPGWKSRDGVDFIERIGGLELPQLSFGAAADKNDPAKGCELLLSQAGGDDKTFVFLGKSGGFSVDYGHAEMIASKPAATEVWPRIREWLDARR